MRGAAAGAAALLRTHWIRLSIAVGLVLVFFGNPGFRGLVGNWRELRGLRAEISQLEAEEKTLEARLKNLRAGEGGLERAARKDLGYIKRGEIEYRFSPPDKQ